MLTKTILAMTLFATLALPMIAVLPSSFGAEDLVMNGGFETGYFVGWNAPCQVSPYFGSCAIVPPNFQAPYGPRYDSSYEIVNVQPRSGRYSARIGTTVYTMGTGSTGLLSQNVVVPAKSKATITFWYKVEKGAKLTFVLRDVNGSDIAQKTFGESFGWTLFKHELGGEYAGKTISLIFQGTAFSEPSQRYEAVYLENTIWFVLVDFKQSYYTYLDDVSVIAEPVQ
jgi:hypothetical protein